MTNPKISVLMTVYNAQKYLKVAIDSILSQTFLDFEFVIVDDCSTDKSVEIIKSFVKKDSRIKFFKMASNMGTTKALNFGLNEASGKYIVRMDADDWSYSDRLKNQYKFMEDNPDIGVSGGYVSVCDTNLKTDYERKYPLTDQGLRDIIFLYSPFAHPATIWRRAAVLKVGGYCPNFPLSQDCELYFKIGKKYKFGNIDKPVIKLRMHKKSSSYAKNKLQELYALYARIKAIIEFGYTTRFIDKLYMMLRLTMLVFFPTNLKFYMFNLFRKKI